MKESLNNTEILTEKENSNLIQKSLKFDGQTYVLASSLLAENRVRTLKHEESFAVFDQHGEIVSSQDGEEGLYLEGTRFLSQLEFVIGNSRPLLLNSEISDSNHLLAVNLTNSDFVDTKGKPIRKGSIHVLRSIFLNTNSCYEKVSLTNFSRQSINVPIELRFASDFKDIFEVRGYHRKERGTYLPPYWLNETLILGYHGLDNVSRQTRISVDIGNRPRRPKENGILSFDIPLGQELFEFYVVYDFVTGNKLLFTEQSLQMRFDSALAEIENSALIPIREQSHVSSSSEQFNEWVNRSLTDISMLNSHTPAGLYPYAGVPWFSTTFGRDGIITALQTLWLNPKIAKGVLGFLASTQATDFLPESDAEPGKILHEARSGEMANLDEIPFKKYYGSVDSTPLFIMLAGEYFQATGDIEFIRLIWPNIEAALGWIRDAGDPFGEGFTAYSRKGKTGLVSQCWKDSHDSVFYADGKDVIPPVSICEVQGYVYAAKMWAATIAKSVGKVDFALKLENEAANLKENFHKRFWSDEIGTYAFAIGGDNKTCLVRSSNVGHCLYTGIVKEEFADRVCDVLMNHDSHCGWGIRTLPDGEVRFNPMSYHNGSIWPHDNSIIAMGLARYGRKEDANRILTGMFEASRHFDFSLPELFCGFEKLGGQGPISYPMSCAPQAWAAGSIFYFLQACLGMKINAAHKVIFFDSPTLPEWLHRLCIKQIKVGFDGWADIEIIRHGDDVAIHVVESSGNVAIQTIK